MKYTIELTNKQLKRFKHMNKALIKMGMGFDILSLLEPIENSWESELEKHKRQAYDKGYADGKADAIYNTDLLDELKQVEYNKGYNSAINDYNAMYEWLHDCFVDFEKFLLEKGFYTDEKFSDGFVVGQLMYDLICNYDIAEVISEFKKWQEEKKKAKKINVGDEVITQERNIAVVTRVKDNCVRVMFKDGSGFRAQHTINELTKTGRHFDEVEQLLDKLGSEEK